MSPCRTSKQQPRYSGPDVDFIVCVTIADVPVPPLPSEETVCLECGIPLWVSFKAKATVVAPTICLRCAQKKVTEEVE